MKVKLFIADKSNFRSWRRHSEELEGEINTWLAAHPGIRVVGINQSSNGGSFDTTKVVISIWYETEVRADVAEAGRSDDPARAPDDRFMPPRG
jgi:hypothetical protein